MEKIYLFNSAVPYKLVRQVFKKSIEEYLVDSAWKEFLSYIVREKSWVVDRDSNVYLREIPTYLNFNISCGVFLYLYDGEEKVERNIKISDDFRIKGVVIPPEFSENDPIIEGLVMFIKTEIDLYVKRHVSDL